MTRTHWAATAITAALLVFAPAARAADGAIHISILRAQEGAINGSLVSDPAGYPVRITEAGSYVLTSALAPGDANTTAIEIAADDVHIDLDGFAIVGVTSCTGDPASCTGTGSGDGIACSGTAGNISIRNGTIRGMGNSGIDCRTSHEKIFVEDMRLIGNGGQGVITGDRSSVVGCLAVRNGSTGIEIDSSSLLRHNVAASNGGSGISGDRESLLEENVTATNGDHGIYVNGSNTIVANTAHDNGMSGIVMPKTLNALSYGTIRYNAASENATSGIVAGIGTNIVNNAAWRNTATGIYAGGGSSVLGNAASENDDGIVFQGGKTDIAHGHNNAGDNTTSQMGSGNQRIGCDVVGGTQTCP